jgi:P-type Cu+ transporter
MLSRAHRTNPKGHDMTDPVCGMQVTVDDAAAAWEYEGSTYYFCSLGCFERFRADPDGILAADPSTRSM